MSGRDLDEQKAKCLQCLTAFLDYRKFCQWATLIQGWIEGIGLAKGGGGTNLSMAGGQCADIMLRTRDVYREQH